MEGRSTCLVVLLLLHFTANIVAVMGAVLYVSPSSPAPGPCPPNEPCHTLSEYAHNIDKYITNSTEFVFLPGTHYLDTDFRVSNVSTLVLLGDNSTLPEPSSRVVCNSSAAMIDITGMSQLFIGALEVTDCGQTVSGSMRVERVENFTLSSFRLMNSGTLSVFNSTALLEDASFANGTQSYCRKMNLDNSRISFGGTVVIENVSDVNCDGGYLGYSCHSMLTLLPNSGLRFAKNSGITGKRGVFYTVNTTLNLMSNVSLQAIENTGSLYLNQSTINLMPNASMTFIGNAGHLYGAAVLIGSTLNLMPNSSMVFRRNSIVLNGGALILITSVLNVSSHTSVVFSENSAGGSGGALVVFQSRIYFSSHTSMEFTRNTANVTGGALYVPEVTPSLYCYSHLINEIPILFNITFNCFFQVPKNYSDISLVFDDNKAPVGSDVFGGFVDICKQQSGVYTDVFSDITCNSSRLGISSPPYQLCYCNTSTNDYADGPSHNYEVHPGETVSIPVLTMGQRQGPSPATLVAYPNTSRESILNIATSNECSPVNFTAKRSGSVSVEYSFFVLNCAKSRLLTNVPSMKISISLTECPPFFELAATGTCQCADAIEDYAVSCDINHRSVAREHATWIGYDAEKGYAVHRHCPLDYCDHGIVHITSDDLDKQCVHNRAGLLCGKCKANYSLLLGTSRCGKCSNYNLFLLLFFAFAGIALVVLLLVLRLTVAEGTINGLIFYANILYLMKYQFFGTEGELSAADVFLAWLNLDFGIESCFYDGMDTYQNIWLQFLFPLYIWVLIGTVMLCSTYSSWMTRKLGTNPVAVLATLILLSFNKIVYTITTVFAVTTIKYTDVNSSEFICVWLFDANHPVEFYGVLFIASLLIVVFLVLPYTLFLVFGQCLQSKSYLRVFSWVNRPTIKCFLDNYHAPYQTSHRYWTGLMVLARLGLLIGFAFNISNDQSQYMMGITLVVVFLLTWGWILGVSAVYKKRWVGILDASFILNLGVVTALTAYCFSTENHCSGRQGIIGDVSLGVASLTFVGILIYHVHMQVKDTALGRKLAGKFRGRCKKTEDDTDTLSDEGMNTKLI